MRRKRNIQLIANVADRADVLHRQSSNILNRARGVVKRASKSSGLVPKPLKKRTDYLRQARKNVRTQLKEEK